jgi:L-lactate utilization protein LutC
MNPDELNQQFIELCKKFGFNPVFLKEILRLRNLGYNNTQIAEQTGISRVTVNTYIEKIRAHENQEALGKLILLGIGLYIGVKILDELFGERR